MKLEFLMVLIIFPLLSFFFGMLGQIIIKKILIVVGINFLFWLIAAFTIFNESFLIWVFIYSILTFLGAGIVYTIRKNEDK